MTGRSGAARLAVAWLALLTAGTANAQYEDEVPLPSWYLGPMVGYAIPDSARDAKSGLNLQFVIGKVLAESVAVELTGFGTKFGADTAGGPDADLTGAGLDLALGTPDRGNPVFLLGAGAVRDKIGGLSKTRTYGELGLGIYLPFAIGDELWRLEARYHALVTDHPALPDEGIVEDIRVNLGVFFTFGREEPTPAPAPEPAPPSAPTPPVEAAPPPPPPPPQPEPAPAAPVAPPAPPAAPLDADSDGVADAKDACPGTAEGTKVDARGCVIPTDVVIRSAYFGSSSSSLTAKGYELLRAVAAAMKAEPRMRLEIEGHSDMSGPAVKNLPLSQERADVVREFLISLGVEPGRLVARGYGETRPVNDNKTLEKRAANRRVQFRRLDE